MVALAVFSLMFLLIGAAIGYLFGKGVNVPLPQPRLPQAITGTLAKHKEKITGIYTGPVRPLSPKDLAEEKETKALMEFQNEQEPLS